MLFRSKRAVSPAFFQFLPSKYVAAVHTSGASVGPTGLIAGANFAPAKPGETIMLFGTGFGPTNAPLASGQVISQPAQLANPVTILIGGKQANVPFAGLSGSGLDQLNVTVPPDLPDGDQSLVAIINGVQSQDGVSIRVQR